MMGPAEHAFKLALVIKEASPFMLDKLRKEFTKLFGAVEQLTKITKNWRNEIVKLSLLGMTGLVLAIGSAAKIMIFMDDKMAIMAQRFGMARGEIGKFNKEMYAMATSAGIVVDQIAEVAHELIEAGFKGRTSELVSLSASVFKFSEFTGISLKSAAGFSAELSKIGMNSTFLMDKLANLRRSLQLSTQEFEEVLKVTEEATKATYSYGKAAGTVNETQIQEFGAGIGQLSAQLRTMGISATTTSKLMSGLMDPNAFRENTALFVTMGFTLDEMFDNLEGRSKTFQDTEQMIGRFGDGMKRLSEGGGLWMAHWAKQLGIPAYELQRIAEGFRNITPEQKAMMAEEMKVNELWKEMGATITPLMRAWRQFFSTFILLIKPAVDVLSLFLNKFSGYMQGVAQGMEKITTWMGKAGTGLKNTFGVIMLVAIGTFVAFIIKASKHVFGMVPLVGSLSTNMASLATNTNLAANSFNNLSSAMVKNAGVSATAGNAANVATTAAIAKGLPGGLLGFKPLIAFLQPLYTLLGATAGKSAILGIVNTVKTVAKFLPAALGIGLTALSMMGSKKFTITDVGTLCMGLGMIPGMQALLPIGAAILGIGILTDMLSGGKLGTLFSWGPKGLKWGAQNPTAEETKGGYGTAEAAGIQQKQEQMSFIGKDNSFRTYEGIEKLLRELKEEAKKTNSAITHQTGVQKNSSQKSMDEDKINNLFTQNQQNKLKQGAGRGVI